MKTELDISSVLPTLRLLLQEDEYPHFTDESLELLYKLGDRNINLTCYKACLLKATSDDVIKVGPIEIKSSGKDYWLKLADTFYDSYKKEQEELKMLNGYSKYKNSMNRVDGN